MLKDGCHRGHNCTCFPRILQRVNPATQSLLQPLFAVISQLKRWFRFSRDLRGIQILTNLRCVADEFSQVQKFKCVCVMYTSLSNRRPSTMAARQNPVPALVTRLLDSAFRMTLKQRCSPSCRKTSCAAQRAVRTHIHIPHGSESQHFVYWHITSQIVRQLRRGKM